MLSEFERERFEKKKNEFLGTFMFAEFEDESIDIEL